MPGYKRKQKETEIAGCRRNTSHDDVVRVNKFLSDATQK